MYADVLVDPSASSVTTTSFTGETYEQGQVNAFIYSDDTRYTAYTANAVSNLVLGIVTNRRDVSYTLTFNVPYSTVGLTLTDFRSTEGIKTFTMENGGSYTFSVSGDPAYTAGTNSVITDRFVINYVAPSAVTSVTTNAYGWATFSYSEDLVPVNATAQTLYKGAINGSYLDLTSVDYVPNGQGVLVKGEANTTYYFAAGTATSDFSANALLATSSYSYPMENVYVLKGNAFQPYEGTNALAANKAYIRLSANNAPARISFRFNGAQAIENAEMEDAKAVKFVENGQIFIRRGEAVYNMQGQIVK